MGDHHTLKSAQRRSVTIAAAVLISLGVAITGCANDAGENTPASPSSSAPPSELSTTQAPMATGTPTAAAAPIVIELNGDEIAGELNDSATAASLLAQLSLTLTFRDYGGQEKVAELPEPLDLRGAPEGSDAAPLTIGYYVPDQRLVLYYARVEYFDGIVPIGTYTNAGAVENQTSEFTVTIHAP